MSISKNEYKHYERYSDKCKFKSPEEELEYSKNTTKKCNKCGRDLTLINFGLNTAGSSPFDKDGYRYRRGDCIECNKKQNEGKNAAKKLAKSLGIETKAPDGTKCEICGRTEKIPDIQRLLSIYSYYKDGIIWVDLSKLTKLNTDLVLDQDRKTGDSIYS